MPTAQQTQSLNMMNAEQPHSLTDSALGGSTSPDDIQHKSSQCSSISDREENFESYGENDDVEYDNDVDVVDSPVKTNLSPPLSDRNFVRRNTWFRTSLRRSPGSKSEQLVPPRRWGSFRHSTKRTGSNALASALYNNGFNGSSPSGRSSNCDDGDMQSDISLEEDVNDLNHKVQLLQQQVGNLAESQASTDDKYTKVKQDNTALTARIHMLEEHIRELEIRSEERLEEEQKRNKELLARLERERELEVENYAIRLATLERDHSKLTEETVQLRSQIDRLKLEKSQTEEKLSETTHNFLSLQEDHVKLQEILKREQQIFAEKQNESSQLIEELYKEIENLRSSPRDSGVIVESSNHQDDVFGDLPARIGELEKEVRYLREQNGALTESNEELHAQMLNRGLEEGKILINGGPTSANDDSLAAELEAMNESEGSDEHDPLSADSYAKVRNTLKEQQEVNAQLRRYIDGILMNIMEKYPELLEVRTTPNR